jgi:hypothetical protein
MVKSYGPFCLGIQHQGSTHIIDGVEVSVSDNLDKWGFPKSWLDGSFHGKSTPKMDDLGVPPWPHETSKHIWVKT